MADRCYRRSRHLAWRCIGDETIVVDAREKRIYGLNPSGGALWQALEEPRTCAQLAELVDDGDSSHPDPRPGVRGFVDQLLGLELIEETADGAPSPPPVAPAAEPAVLADPVPRLMWNDEIRAVAQSCNFTPVMPGPCQIFPMS